MQAPQRFDGCVQTVDFPVGAGIDVAAVIDQIGESGTDLAIGDEGPGPTSSGGHAELVLAAVDKITANPAGELRTRIMAREVEGALPVAAATTTYRAPSRGSARPAARG
jgi:NADPH:quinone reductase-like Zn-dependent oxidoreductase